MLLAQLDRFTADIFIHLRHLELLQHRLVAVQRRRRIERPGKVAMSFSS